MLILIFIINRFNTNINHSEITLFVTNYQLQ